MGLVVPRHVESSRTGMKPVSPGLASRFLTTEPPGMPPSVDSKSFVMLNRESRIYKKGKKNEGRECLVCKMKKE